MDQRDNIKKELEELAPTLAGLEKKNPFSVPTNYFKGLPSEIQEIVTPPKPPSANVWDLVRQYILKPQFSLAIAAVLIVSIGGYRYLKNTPIAEGFDPLQSLAMEDAGNYIMENIEEFDEDLLFDDALAMLEESDLLDQSEITEENIDDILLDEIDESILEEELL